MCIGHGIRVAARAFVTFAKGHLKCLLLLLLFVVVVVVDMLDADGGCNSAVTARVRSVWKKFREYLPIVTGKGFSLKLKGKVYATCVRSCLVHGSETWLMKVEHESG